MGRTATATSGVPRLKRNNATENLQKMTVPTKRKADEELKPTEMKTRKRAAFGDITNALSDKSSSSNQAGKSNQKPSTSNQKPSTSNLKNQVKKVRVMVGMSKPSGLKVKETKASTLRQNAVKGKTGKVVEKAAEKIEESATEEELSINSLKTVSSSSEEVLFCNVGTDDSEIEEDAVDKMTKKKKVVVEETFEIPEPERQTPPEGVVDFDLENMADPHQHSQYAMETFRYYKERETVFRIPNYVSAQLEITEAMRAILVDWLVEVQESFELNHETLYAAVKMTDLYLSKKQVRKEDLQLVGATACLVACKIDERIPPMVDDFLYVCDDAYTRDQLMKMERKMLAVVGFDLGYPLSYRILRRYGRVCKVTMPVLTLARYILEMSLMEYNFNVELSESKLAASCLVLAFKMKGIEGWVDTLKYYSDFSPLDLQSCVSDLHKMLQKPPKDNLKTVRSKYSHKVFHEVATTALPDTIELTQEG